MKNIRKPFTRRARAGHIIEVLEARIAPAFGAVVELSALMGTDGFKISGVAAGDRSGVSVSAAGDINGDGIDDVIVGAQSSDPNGTDSGASYVVFGSSAGFAANLNLSALTGANGFKISGAAAGDASGISVSGAGDVNGDGIDDLIIGAVGADPNGSGSGASYVVFGSRTAFAANLNLSTLTGANGFKISGAAASDQSGSVSAAGDINGDGIDDLIIGALGADPNGSSSGASYVVFGSRAAFAANLNVSSLTGANGFKISGVAANDQSGYLVSGAGDINADGIDDLIIGAPFGDSTFGAGYVVFGSRTAFAANLNLSGLTGANGFKIGGAAAADRFGISVSGAGDINGDGMDDLIVGAQYADPNGGNSGASYVVFGSRTAFGASLALSSLTGANGFKISGEVAGDRSGFSVSAAGDINGDGIDDVIIGAVSADPHGADSGANYVVFGSRTAFAANLNLSSLTGPNGFQISGVAALDVVGFSVSGAGDINGDGIDDLIMGTPYADPNGSYSGASYVIFGQPAVAGTNFAADIDLGALTGSDGFKLSGVAVNNRSGFTVSIAGDINGDGFDDIVIGADKAPNGTYVGASYVVFGKATGFATNLNLSTLDGTIGFKLTGVASNDFSGHSVSGAGDVNGDGFDDLIIGAFNASPNGSFSGASYVVFGKASGFAADLNLATLTGTNGFKLSGVAGGDYSGTSVSGAGDVNGDGFADIIVGAEKAGGIGASYVVYGKESGFGANLNLSTLTGTNGFKISGELSNDAAGRSVSGAGDVNGDGFDDLIIGAFGADTNGSLSGTTYVVFGKASSFGANLNLSTLDGTTGFKLSGVAADDRSGISVSGAGDVNNDGFADLIVGAFFADPNGSNSGASYVVFGKATGFAANLNLSTLTGTNGFKISGVGANDASGIAVSSAGDFNGDGFADLIVGANGATGGAAQSGASYVVFGKASGFAANLNLSTLDGTSGFKLSGVGASESTGAAVSGAGDINGDGLDDLIVGAYRASPNGSNSGASYVVFGHRVASTPTLTATLTAGNLTVLDTAGSENSLTVSVSGADLVITDAIESFSSAPAGGTLSNGDKTLTIPLSLITAGLTLDAAGLDDTITFSTALAITGDLIVDTGAGTGMDSIVVSGALTPTGHANFTSAGGVIFSQSVTMAVNKNFTVNATGTVSLAGTNADIIADGTGAISLTTMRNISLASGSSVTAVNGGITLHANQQVTPTAGAFVGLDANGALIQTTGTGAIDLRGRGGDDAGTGNHFGVYLQNGASVTSTASGGSAGTITITGTGGNGTIQNYGVGLIGTSTDVTSVSGAIAITGTGMGTGNNNLGVFIFGIEKIESTGTGASAATITITGTGGNGTNSNHGINLSNATTDVTSVDGAITITGSGGNGSGNTNQGVNMDNDAVVQVTTASLTVTGTAGGGNSSGLVLNNVTGARLVSIGSGSIVVTADGNGSSADLLAGADSIIGGVSATGPVNLNADSISLAGTTSVQTTGAVTILPRTAGNAINLGAADSAGVLGLTDAELDQVTAGTLQIGNASSGAITVSAAITHGNNLSLTTGAGVTFNNAVTMAANKNFTVSALGTSNGTINFATANADLAASGTGAISLTTVRDFNMFPASGWSMTTANGNITLNANQQVTQTAGAFYGMQASNGLIEATGSGNIVINARGGITATATFAVGIAIDPNTTVRTNTGSVTMSGVGGQSGTDGNTGVQVHSGSVVESTGGGSIDLTGTGGGRTSGAGQIMQGIRVLLGGIVRTTGAGDITLTGTGGAVGAASNNYGVRIDNASLVTSSGSGTITINAIGGANNAPAFRTDTGTNRLGFDGTNSYSGNVIINADSMDITGAVIQTTGTATLRQQTNGTLINLGAADSAGVLGLTDAELDQITAGTVQIGNSSSGAITVSAPITHADASAIVLTAGTGQSINLDSSITTADGPVTFSNAVLLGTATATVDTTNAGGTTAGGQVLFSGTIDADAALNARNLVVAAGELNAVTFSGAVGAIAKLDDITASGGSINVFAPIAIDGALSAASSGSMDIQAAIVTTSGSVTLSTVTFNFPANGSIDVGAGTVNIHPFHPGWGIELGLGIGGPSSIGISESGLDRITAGTIVLGNNATGPISIQAHITRATATDLYFVGGDESLLGSGNANFTFQGNTSINTGGGSLFINLLSAGSARILSGTGANDIIANTMDLSSGTGGIGLISDPLRFDAEFLGTQSFGGSQFLFEKDTVAIHVTDLSAGIGAIHFISGTFTANAFGHIDTASSLTISSGSTTLDLAGFSQDLAALNGNGDVLLGGATLTVTEGVFSGALIGTGNLTKAGAGTVFALTGSQNTFTGAITIADGTLEVDGDDALGNPTNIVTFAGPTSILRASESMTTARTFNIPGVSGIIEIPSGTVTFNGSVTSGGSLKKIGNGTLLFGTFTTGDIIVTEGATTFGNTKLTITGPGDIVVHVVDDGMGGTIIEEVEFIDTNTTTNLFIKGPTDGTTTTIKTITSADPENAIGSIKLGKSIILGDGLADTIPDVQITGRIGVIIAETIAANTIIELGKGLPYNNSGDETTPDTYNNRPNLILGTVGAGVIIDVTGNGIPGDQPGAVGGGGLGNVIIKSWPGGGIIRTTQSIGSFILRNGDANVVFEVDKYGFGAQTTANVGKMVIQKGSWGSSGSEIEGEIGQFNAVGFLADATIAAGSFKKFLVKTGTFAGTATFTKPDAPVAGSILVKSDFLGSITSAASLKSVVVKGNFSGSLAAQSIGSVSAFLFDGARETEAGDYGHEDRHNIVALNGSLGVLNAKAGGVSNYDIYAATIASGIKVKASAGFGIENITFDADSIKDIASNRTISSSIFAARSSIANIVIGDKTSIAGTIDTQFLVGVNLGGDGLVGGFSTDTYTRAAQLGKFSVTGSLSSTVLSVGFTPGDDMEWGTTDDVSAVVGVLPISTAINAVALAIVTGSTSGDPATNVIQADSFKSIKVGTVAVALSGFPKIIEVGVPGSEDNILLRTV